MVIRIGQHYLHASIALLAIVETALFYGAVYAGAYLRFAGDTAAIEWSIGRVYPAATIFALAMFAGMISMGLYFARQRSNVLGVMVRVAAALMVGFMGTTLAFYVFPELLIGRGVIGLAMLLAFCGVMVVRVVFSHVAAEELFKRRVLIFGAGNRAASVGRLRRRTDQRGFKVVGFLRVDGDHETIDEDRVIEIDGPLVQYARQHDVDEIVIAMDDRRRGFPLLELLDCRLSGIDVIDLPTFLERETGKVQLEILNPSWLIFADGFTRTPLRMASKRAFDLAASLVLLLLTWPVMLLTVIAIKIEEGFHAPVLYRQIRVGMENEDFELLKFRSMCIDAEEDGTARWATPNDSRITRVGSVIRKCRVDELPQLFNVIRGEMSFVGPRPERPEFVEPLNETVPYYRERHSMPPGITGWAQLCYPYGSSSKDATEKLKYDLYYVKNHSLLFDLMILLQTAEVILWGKGAR